MKNQMKQFTLRKTKPIFSDGEFVYQVIDPETGKTLFVKSSRHDYVAAFVHKMPTYHTAPFFFPKFQTMGEGLSERYANDPRMVGVAIIETVHIGGYDHSLIRSRKGDQFGQVVDLLSIPERFQDAEVRFL